MFENKCKKVNLELTECWHAPVLRERLDFHQLTVQIKVSVDLKQMQILVGQCFVDFLGCVETLNVQMYQKQVFLPLKRLRFGRF
jgi:uncharacterized protein related to proFAR isomerase